MSFSRDDPVVRRNPDDPDTSWRRVFVRDLVLPCRIGAGDEERASPQPVRITVELLVAEDQPIDDQDLATVVDYTPLIRRIEEAVSRPVRLVEALGERIAGGCFFDPRIRTARIRVEKPELLGGGAAVGVEIERLAPEL
jgi:7,8-dihydroneopterin aldolase/epimerase/oxygenase